MSGCRASVTLKQKSSECATTARVAKKTYMTILLVLLVRANCIHAAAQRARIKRAHRFGVR